MTPPESFRYRIDLGFEGVRLAIEYDGRWHDTDEQREHDEARRAALSTDDGWTFVIVHAEDLFEQPAALLDRLVSELRGHGVPGPGRAWRTTGAGISASPRLPRDASLSQSDLCAPH